MRKKRFRGLFFNAVLALSLISLVPLVFIAIHLTRVNTRLLQHEIFQTQQTIAGQLAAVVHTYMTHTSEFFTVFLDLHIDFGGHAFLNRQDLNYLQRKDIEVSALTLLSAAGEPLMSVGTPTQSYEKILPQLIHTCIVQRENYLSDTSAMVQQNSVLMAFPVYGNLKGARPEGVLVAEVSLHSLEKTLAQVYPLEMEVFIVNDKQEIVAYNGAPEGVSSAKRDELNEKIKAIATQLGENVTGEIALPDKHKWLVASADLFLPGWKVYVAQPANVVSKLVLEGTLHSRWGVVRIVLIMILFILGVSYWVIIPITRPVERLRKAALRVRDGKDIIIHREDVEIPNNEIGDLAEEFVDMSNVLHKRREELLAAQTQLAQANQALEKRVEERTRELKDASAKLVRSERLATMGQMASIISHEIRNPLAVISNATRLIKMLVKTPEGKIEKQISIIEAEIKQANSIISEVLGYVRSREPILNKVELNSYIKDILTSYPLPAGITLVEKLEPMAVHVKIDTEEMKQAFRNLISNAVEAMQNQGTLTVGVQSGKDMVCIYVADTGPGVAPDIRQKIFAPFFTTKARGTGLGLAVVEKAVSRHQGKLFITSEEGKGACFQIYLKIYRKIGDTRYGESS